MLSTRPAEQAEPDGRSAEPAAVVESGSQGVLQSQAASALAGRIGNRRFARYVTTARTAQGATADARVALARAVGNRAVARQLGPAPRHPRVLSRQSADLTDSDAMTALNGIKLVVSSPNVSSQDQKQNFLRAGKERFGTFRDTIAWFSAIRPVKVPGGVFLHESAATRLEAVSAAMGADMPATGGGFELRSPFTASSHLSRLSHHTLGLAIDYDVTDMVRIGSVRTEVPKPGDAPVQTSHTVDFLEAVTGQSTHLNIGGADRRSVIKQMGDATAAGTDLAKVRGATDLLAAVKPETDRLAAASEAFRKSLGDKRDAFLALRDEFFSLPPSQRGTAMAKLPPLVQPWIDALTKAENDLLGTATAYGYDRDKLPGDDALRQRITKDKAFAGQVDSMAVGYAADDDGTTPQLSPADEMTLSNWEQQLHIGSIGNNLHARIATIGDRVHDEIADLTRLIGATKKIEHYHDVKKMLVSDSAFVFGSGAKHVDVADTPPIAQMVDRGFFTPGKPGSSASDRGNFDAKFISEMAKHGFDIGACWGGPTRDAMHFELVTTVLGI